MATTKIEKVLNWGVAYTPEMDKGGKRPQPRWDTLRDQVREATELGYDTAVAVETQHDPFLALAIAAQEPSPIELSTGIALAFTKSPGGDRVHRVGPAYDERRTAGAGARLASQRDT